MSCIVWPRTASGLCSPSAQSTASVMFDLPQPFGPTITLTPGENTSLVRSAKDLKPLIVIELRCMESAPRPWVGSLSGRTAFAVRRLRARLSYRPPALQRFGRGGLLGGLLASALAPCRSPRRRPRRHLEATIVRRARLAGDLVGYAGAFPGQPLLKRGLEVEQGLRGELDLFGERRRPSPRRSPRSRGAGSRRRSPPRRPTPAPAR